MPGRFHKKDFIYLGMVQNRVTLFGLMKGASGAEPRTRVEQCFARPPEEGRFGLPG
ncbi:hypothetical protein NEPTK9_001641 [Candidatus Neptunochlamydia vexilliferae]|uniref:Transposase n=1 Tax=Candidatus Neptunichlamydia vexilliferae TaxID=1651774 RepID=A0ABS0B2Z8_9BACT|nr:hypothetical protein [Candidatus Neptunochlamydia vexilliferae]